MKAFFILLLACQFAAEAQAADGAQFKWVRTASSSGGGGIGLRIFLDSMGNVRVQGSFGTGRLDFGSSVLTNEFVGGVGGFLATYTPSGGLDSTWKLDAAGDAGIRDIELDQQGNTYFTGYFYNSIRFGTHQLNGIQNNHTLYFAKMDEQKAYEWAIGGPLESIGNQVEIDSDGNLWLGGLDENGSRWFLSKYNADGERLWEYGESARWPTRSMSLQKFALLQDNSAIAVVRAQLPDTPYQNSLAYSLTATRLAANGKVRSATVLRRPSGLPLDFMSLQSVLFDAYRNIIVHERTNLTKYTAEGNLLWTTTNVFRWPTSEIVVGSSQATISPSGYIYVCSPSAISTEGGAPLWIQIFKPNGEELLSKMVSANLSAMGIAADEYGNAYVTGRISGGADFDEIRVEAQSEWDFYVAALEVPYSPPMFQSTNIHIVNAGSNLVFTNIAFSTHALTYELGPDAPAESKIDQRKGIFDWRAPLEAAGTSEIFTVLATDRSVPANTATQVVTVAIPHVASIQPVESIIKGGAVGELRLPLYSSAQLEAVDFIIDIPETVTTNITVDPMVAPGVTATVTKHSPGRHRVEIRADNGDSFQGSNTVVVKFNAGIPPQSTVTEFGISELKAQGAGAAITDVRSSSARMILLGDRPLLEFGARSGDNLELVLYGDEGASYALLGADIIQGQAWGQEVVLQLTNGSARTSVPVESTRRFYRAVRE